MNKTEFYTQKVEPIKEELESLGWSVAVNKNYITEFKRDSVLIYFFPENYTNKKYKSNAYPVGTEFRDLSYSLRYEFLPTIKSRNVTEKTKPYKIIEHLQSLYNECSQAFNDEIALQDKLDRAKIEKVEKLEQLKNLFNGINGRIFNDKVEFYHKGYNYSNTAELYSDGYKLTLNGLTFEQLTLIKNILEI